MATLDKPPYFSPTGGYYLKQLFWEQSITLTLEGRAIKPVFSLYKDKPGCVNFGRRYVELADPSGYKIAKELLRDYAHWQQLVNCKWFIEAKNTWDQELDAQLQSEGLDKIRELAGDVERPAVALAAAKYLANKEYKKDRTATKGRPKAEDVARAAHTIASKATDTAEDYKRILGVVNGNGS